MSELIKDSTVAKTDEGQPVFRNREMDLSARRTGMAFQRTRMAADRTLMAVIRTSLSLITFGFTIAQFFERLKSANVLADGGHASRNFGIALVGLGIAMLVFGIIYHLQFMMELRRTRSEMTSDNLIHGKSGFPASMTLVTAITLLAIGIAAIISMIYSVGPFG